MRAVFRGKGANRDRQEAPGDGERWWNEHWRAKWWRARPQSSTERSTADQQKVQPGFRFNILSKFETSFVILFPTPDKLAPVWPQCNPQCGWLPGLYVTRTELSRCTRYRGQHAHHALSQTPSCTGYDCFSHYLCSRSFLRELSCVKLAIWSWRASVYQLA